MHAFGKLTIVPSCDLGDLGPTEGARAEYTWNPLVNLIGLAPWLVLVGLLVGLRENRHWQALWIVLPLIGFRLLWAGLARLMDAPSEAVTLFAILIDCLLIGFAANWLLAERIGNRNRFVTWLLAWAIFGAVFGVALASFGVRIYLGQMVIILGVTAAVVMVSFVLAGFACRRKFGPVRFSLWMALWVLLTTVTMILSVILIPVVMSGISVTDMLAQVAVVSLVYAGIVIGGLLPFEVLLFVNRFWRRRFEAVFRLGRKEAQPTPEAESERVPV